MRRPRRGRGTLTLDYAYTDDTGAAARARSRFRTRPPPPNTVVATASPAGQITAAIKGGSQAVAVTFDTDDGKAASDLLVTTALGALPAGWQQRARAASSAPA